MEDIVTRLERVTAKLEAFQVNLESGSSTIAPSPPISAPAPPKPAASSTTSAVAPSSGSVAAYQALLDNDVRKVLDAGEAVGGEVLRATRILADAFHRELEIVAAFAACHLPSSPSDLQSLLQPTSDKIMEAGMLTSGPRSPYSDHFMVIAESANALGWAAYQPGVGLALPPQHVDDAWGAAEFYGTKVLMGWKAKGSEHGEWIASIKSLLMALKAYCAKYHAAGPAWNTASGIPLKDFKFNKNAANAAAVNKAGPPPPPPPPPPGTLIQPKTAAPAPAAAASGGAMAALFADINRGTAVTAGLRKVTDDMKTKNRTDKTGTVPAAAAKPAAIGTKQPFGPPRLECEQGRKWVVENWTGNRDLVVENTEPKQSVYIFNCHDCTVQIKGKVNAITLDGCSKCGVVFDTVVASFEIVNCKSVQVQCKDAAPTVSIEKTDGCQVYMTKKALAATAITTAKISELNVVALGENDEEEPQEFAIPEQFVSRYRDGKMVTEILTHSGG